MADVKVWLSCSKFNKFIQRSRKIICDRKVDESGVADERLVNLNKTTGGRITVINKRVTSKRMETKDPALYSGFCKQRNKQNPFGNIKWNRIMTCIMADQCSKVLREKTSPNARKINGSAQCVN